LFVPLAGLYVGFEIRGKGIILNL